MQWRRNGNPLQYSCLENPRDGGAWWAALYGVAQSWTRLKRLSSSSSSSRGGVFCGASWPDIRLFTRQVSWCRGKGEELKSPIDRILQGHTVSQPFLEPEYSQLRISLDSQSIQASYQTDGETWSEGRISVLRVGLRFKSTWIPQPPLKDSLGQTLCDHLPCLWRVLHLSGAFHTLSGKREGSAPLGWGELIFQVRVFLSLWVPPP